MFGNELDLILLEILQARMRQIRFHQLLLLCLYFILDRLLPVFVVVLRLKSCQRMAYIQLCLLFGLQQQGNTVSVRFISSLPVQTPTVLLVNDANVGVFSFQGLLAVLSSIQRSLQIRHPTVVLNAVEDLLLRQDALLLVLQYLIKKCLLFILYYKGWELGLIYDFDTSFLG